MPTTPNLGLPYPPLSNTPNVPADIQNLATTMDGLCVVGGKHCLNPGVSVATTETIVVDTPTLSLAASSVFTIEFYCTFNVTVVGSDILMGIRQTSVTGTLLAQSAALGVYLTNNYGIIRMTYTTTAAELDYFAGTIVRTGTGTGNASTIPPTHLVVTRHGPSSLIGNY